MCVKLDILGGEEYLDTREKGGRGGETGQKYVTASFIICTLNEIEMAASELEG
jgi:hypothetical protein